MPAKYKTTSRVTGGDKVERPKFKRVKEVAFPLSHWVEGEEKLFRILDPITTSENEQGKESHRAHIIDHSTGTEMRMYVDLSLYWEFEKYEKDSYVGVDFVSVATKIPGKRWMQYSLAEIELEK